MPDRVRKLARVLPRPLDSLVERSHANYVGVRSRRLVVGAGEPPEHDGNGLPLPPRHLRRLVAASDDTSAWLQTGAADAALIRSLVEEHVRPMDQLATVLDFGCGCGRVARWWSDLAGPEIHGCDYDGVLTAWCRRNLSFMKVKTNASGPPLPFRRASFDLIYAISLFTHLTPAAQDSWMADVRRVLKPGGVYLFTVHGERFGGHLSVEQRARFDAGELVVLQPELNGREGCATFHPPAYVRESLVHRHGFELVAAVHSEEDGRPVESPMALHDIYLVRKPRH